MPYDSNYHHRRSIRLRGYDYTQAGAYFVTTCVQNREPLFGEIVGGSVRLNVQGEIAVEWWDKITGHFQGVELDAFVVMPNHMHGIVVLTEPLGIASTQFVQAGASGEMELPLMTSTSSRPMPLGRVMAFFKYQSTKAINQARATPGARVWQRNYYEHVVRNDGSLRRIREYIASNPLQWEQDQLHPENPSKW
jgi:REP element-mobilizing transposase RayT